MQRCRPGNRCDLLTLRRLRDTIRRFDTAVDQAFSRLRGHRSADYIFYVASEAADYSVAWHLTSLTIALADPARRRHSIRLAVALGVESMLVNGVIKRATKRERPPLLEERAFLVRRPKTTSFPSGHASSATMAAVLLSDTAPRLRPLWVLAAATVSASRVHNRMHHGSDVVAGAALGAVMAAATKAIWPLDR